MIVESKSPTLLMAAGELLRLPEGSCARVECAGGAVWVTQEGDRNDRVLSAGESARIGSGSLALVQAFEPSLIRVVAAPTGCAPAARAGERGWRKWFQRPSANAAATLAA